MTSRELENLVKTNNLKREPPSRREFEGLLQSGEARLKDASNEALADESRFDLAYNAAHALALAALRRLGYRSESRYLVFQTLPHTVGVPASVWRVLALCHERRNRAEYEGLLEVDDRLLADLVDAARVVLEALRALPRPDIEA
jgi:hypothetical protein